MNTSVNYHANNIKFLEFELNNQCQYANVHEWCPRHRLGDKPYMELSTDAIYKVIQYFKPYDFNGSVYFSIYNEPLLDARIYDLLRYTKRELPKCTIQMFTNGIALTPEVAKDLKAAGVDTLRVSVYSDNPPHIDNCVYADRRAFGLNDAGYDDRINIYDKEVHYPEPCYMPMQYFMVSCSGEVMLCWDDWKRSNYIGNVYKDNIEDILLNPNRLELIYKLIDGKRAEIIPCSGCDRPTLMCLQEYGVPKL